MASASAQLPISCTNCQEDISGVRVQCCICPEFDICLQCFACGAEIGQHKNDHDYKLIDPQTQTIFGRNSTWTSSEHLLLLDAVELYGFGNWDLVAKHVESRTADEVKEEYINRYLNGNIGKVTFNAPKNTSSAATEQDRETNDSLETTNRTEPNPNTKTIEVSKKMAASHNTQNETKDSQIDCTNRPVIFEHISVEDHSPLNSMGAMPPLDITPNQALLLGYKIHRDDYDKMYKMHSEHLVSKLQQSVDDSDLEIALKLSIVDMYTRDLRERARRERLVRDYQLVSKYFAQMEQNTNNNNSKLKRHKFDLLFDRNSKKPKFEQTNEQTNSFELLNDKKQVLERKFVKFAQFLCSKEHSSLLSSIDRERVLRFRLNELLKYRKLGLKTQEEVFHFEQHQSYEMQQKSGSSGCVRPITTLADPEHQLTTKNGKNDEKEQTSIVERSICPTEDQAGSENKKASWKNSRMQCCQPASCCNNNVQEKCDGWQHCCSEQTVPLDRILSSKEIQFCTDLNIQPIEYYFLKSLIIKDNLLSPNKYKMQKQLDPKQLTVKEAVVQYLDSNGWLP